MVKMYKSVNAATVDTTAQTPTQQPEEPTQQPQTPTSLNLNTGGLLGVVTSIRSLYPVNNAKVTIFTGDYPDMQIIDTDTTDQSGKTKIFTLPTPEKVLSLEEDNVTIPYSSYNMLIEADGYIKNIHLNIPVFSGVTSIQQSNLILSETAGQDKSPQIFDESQKYDL